MPTRVFLALVLVSSLATGCAHRHYDRDHDRHDRHGARRGHGPPPHAPAHGYRAKHYGYPLEFDARRGVYFVIGRPGIYWQSGWFYRQTRDRWQRCNDGDGPWHDARWGDVPIGLRGGYDGKGHGKGKGKKDKGWR